MEVVERRKVAKTHGALVVLRSSVGGPVLEIYWYADDSPVARPYPPLEGRNWTTWRLGWPT